MDIEFLRTFLEVTRVKHFGKAADNLYLTQSAVSARIRLLEEFIGEPVFIRQRNNLQLTPIGKKLFYYAENIVLLWKRAKQEIAFADDDKNVISVGCTAGLWEIYLNKWLSLLVTSDLPISLDTRILSKDSLIRNIQDFTLDLGFTFEATTEENLIIEKVGSINILLVTSHHEYSTDKMLSEDFYYVDWGTSITTELANYWGEKLKPKLTCDQSSIALSLIIEHGGTSYLPEPTISKLVNDKKLFVVKDAPILERKLYAVFCSDSKKNELIKNSLALFDQVKGAI